MTERLLRPSHLEDDRQAVDGVWPAQPPDGNVGGDSGRPRIQQGTLRTPDLEPASVESVIVIVFGLGSPGDTAAGRPLEHLLRNLAIVGEPPIELRGQAVTQEGEHAPRIQGEHRAQGRGVPERQADPDAPMPPPAHHGSPSRRTNPTPRTVWMSFVDAS